MSGFALDDNVRALAGAFGADMGAVDQKATDADDKADRAKLAAGLTPRDFGEMVSGGWGQAIQAAIDYISVNGGGTLNMRGMDWPLGDGETLAPKSGVTLDLTGGKLRATSQATILMTEDWLTNTGTTNNAGPVGFKIVGGEITGTYTVGTAPACGEWEGCGLLYYGRELELDGVKFRNLRGHALSGEYAGTASPYGHKYSALLIENIGRSGWVHNVSDAHAYSVNIRSVARAGEADCDGLQLKRFMRGEMINVWQPGSGGNVENMRYACAALGVAAYIQNATFEHGRDANLYIDPACINARFTDINLHTVRGAGGCAAHIACSDGSFGLTAYNGTVQVEVPLVRIGKAGPTAATGNIIAINKRRQQAARPSSVVEFVNSGGKNIITVAGDNTTTLSSGIPGPVIGGTPHPDDKIIKSVVGDAASEPIALQRVFTIPASGSESWVIPMPNGTHRVFTGTVMMRLPGGGTRYAASFEGVIGRNSGASSTSLPVAPVITQIYANAFSGYDFTITADVTAGGLSVNMTGEGNWSVDLRINEVVA